MNNHLMFSLLKYLYDRYKLNLPPCNEGALGTCLIPVFMMLSGLQSLTPPDETPVHHKLTPA